MNPATACIKTIRACVLTAGRAGMSADEVARRLEFDPALLADPHARVSHALFVRAWEELPGLCGDEAFGLHAAELVGQQPSTVVDYVCAQGPTLREAIGRLLRYQRLYLDEVELALTTEGQEARVTMRLRATACAPRHFSEYLMATWLLRTRALIGPFTPRRVTFQHATPADIGPLRRMFAAPLGFREAASGLVFRAELLAAPVRGADPGLGDLLERHATELLARLPARDDPVHRVKAHLARALPGEVPAIEATARALGSSARTLQRALRAGGTTYQAVVDEVRRDLALGFLREPQRTVSEVAFLVGFTEVAAFTRAFRRWTGELPSAYRHREAR
jgi:AraC-like DNA-binding protein